MFSTETIYKKNPLVSWQKLDNQVLIISEDNQHAHELNEIAAFFWERLDEMPLKKIMQDLTDNYDVDDATLANDITVLVNDLKNKKLIL